MLAVCLAAGLDGIRRELTPPDSIDSNVFKLTEDEREAMGIENIPDNLDRAVRAMKKDSLIHLTLGSHAFRKYVDYKQAEWNEYRNVVTQWELDRYLSRY